jgi:hypothetical protein
VQSVTFFQ